MGTRHGPDIDNMDMDMDMDMDGAWGMGHGQGHYSFGARMAAALPRAHLCTARGPAVPPHTVTSFGRLREADDKSGLFARACARARCFTAALD